MAESSARAAALPVLRVPKDTLQDQVYRQLSDLILNGEIAPGEFVTIQGLSNAFGVSAMPVREALQRLTAAKALTVVSGRSIGVPPLTLERLLDLRRVRLEIESLAAAWAIGRVQGHDIERLEALVKTMAEATGKGEVKLYLRANRDFHFTIYRACGSDVLLGIIESLWLQISPFFHLLHGSGNYTAANAEHLAMLDAIRKGDDEAMRRAVRNDIEGAVAVLSGLLAEKSKL